MVLDYIPLGYDKIDEFFKNTGYADRVSQEEIILDLIDNRFCRYVYKNGKNNGLICGVKSKTLIKDNCCNQHIKDMFPNLYKEQKQNKKKYYIKKNKNDINYCNYKSLRRESCGRKVKKAGDLCYAHKPKYILEVNKICFLFLEIVVSIYIIYMLFIYISIINICKNSKKMIFFGSLKIEINKKSNYYYPFYSNINNINVNINKEGTKKEIYLSTLSFPKYMNNLKNNTKCIKFGSLIFKDKDKYDLIKKRILFKIKILIYFKKIIYIKKNNNNLLLVSNTFYNIVDEPYEYDIENKSNQLNSQTSRTTSYLFLNNDIENINYMKKLHFSINSLIIDFRKKHEPLPDNVKHTINNILNLFEKLNMN